MDNISKNIEITFETINNECVMVVTVIGLPMYCWDESIDWHLCRDEMVELVNKHNVDRIAVYSDELDISNTIDEDDCYSRATQDLSFFISDMVTFAKKKVWWYSGITSINEILDIADSYVMRNGAIFVLGKKDTNHLEYNGQKPCYCQSFNQRIWGTCGKSNMFRDVTQKYEPLYDKITLNNYE
jgi:hypothetical protein